MITDMQSERHKIQNEVWKKLDTEISKMPLNRIGGYETKQRITDAELTISIADLDDANQSISVLKTEIDRLHEENRSEGINRENDPSRSQKCFDSISIIARIGYF